MNKEAVISWEDLQKEFNRISNISCIPKDIKKVPDNYVYDENRSVKWNKEQVELNNKKYQDELARLNTEKNKARDSVYGLIIKRIQQDVGHGLSYEKAKVLWEYAYKEGHEVGFCEIRYLLIDLIDIAIRLLD